LPVWMRDNRRAIFRRNRQMMCIYFWVDHLKCNVYPPIWRLPASIKSDSRIKTVNDETDTISANISRNHREKSMIPETMPAKTWL
jgi:hypothetical protein